MIRRLFVYGVILAAILGLTSFLIQTFGGKLIMRENGPVEDAQILLLLITSILLFLSARYRGDFQHLFKVLWILPLIGVIREADRFLEKNCFNESWEVFFAITVILLIYLIIKDYKNISAEAVKFSETQAFIFFAVGFFTVFSFSRIIGQQSLWQSLLLERNHRAIGGFIEEILELYGYCSLLIGAIECFIHTRNKYNQKINSESKGCYHNSYTDELSNKEEKSEYSETIA